MARQVRAFAALVEDRIDSQHLQCGSETSVTTTSGDPSPPSGLHRLCTQSAHTHMQTLSDIIIITIIESLKTSLLNNVFVSCLQTSLLPHRAPVEAGAVRPTGKIPRSDLGQSPPSSGPLQLQAQAAPAPSPLPLPREARVSRPTAAGPLTRACTVPMAPSPAAAPRKCPRPP